MSWVLTVAFALIFCCRLASVVVSIINERRLKKRGAIEFGKRNTQLLALLHLLFYIAAFSEAYWQQAQFDIISVVGLLVSLFSMAMLAYVIYQLWPIWTVKLILVTDQPINLTPLFKRVRHPNYYLNIIPEILGITLLMKANLALAVIGPFYLASLAMRINVEERVMRETFPAYDRLLRQP